MKMAQAAARGGPMGAVTGALMAKCFMPTPKEIKQCIIYMDLAIKMQII